MHRRQFLRSGAAGLAFCAAPPVRSQAPIPLRFTLDFRITGQVAPFLLALGKGYYDAEGLAPTFDVGSGSVAAITRVASGAYEMGFGDVSSLIEFNATQAGPRLVQAVYQYYNRAPFAIIGRRDRGITEQFGSLAGKRIAAAAVESTRRAWPMAARRAGVDVETFQWVTTDFSQRDNVVVRGDVDGATYFHDSAVSLFQRLDPGRLSVLPFASVGLDLYGNAVLASSKLIQSRPAVVAAFLRATNRGLRESLADPVAAMAWVKRREPLIDERVEAERFAITARYVVTDETRRLGLGAIRPEVFARQVAQVSETFDLKVPPSPDGVFDLSFLPSQADRMPGA